jgi:rod shape-determining protein MreC
VTYQPIFSKSPKVGAKAILLLLLSILIIVVDLRGWCPSLRYALSASVAPIQYSVDFPSSLYLDLKNNLASQKKLVHENEQLKAQQLLMHIQMQKLLALQAENKQLRALLSSARYLNVRTKVAALLAVSSATDKNIIVLNQGKKNSVYVGQPVVDAYGVMGQVIEVGPLTSRVMLVNDPRSALPVEDNRSEQRAIVQGRGIANLVTLNHVPKTADVKEQDLIVTSGLAAKFPQGYPVGRVIHIEDNPGEQFLTVDLELSAHVNRSRLVLLVWPNTAEDGDSD